LPPSKSSSSSFKNLIPKSHPKNPNNAKNRIFKSSPWKIYEPSPMIIPKKIINIFKRFIENENITKIFYV